MAFLFGSDLSALKLRYSRSVERNSLSSQSIMRLAALLMTFFVLLGASTGWALSFETCEGELLGPSIVDYLDDLIAQSRKNPERLDRYFANLRRIEVSDKHIDGARFETIANNGSMNNGVFRLYRKTAPTILKVVRTEGSRASALKQINGGYLGQSLGGPQIVGFGLLTDCSSAAINGGLQLRGEQFFIEMEELFPNKKVMRWKSDWDKTLIRDKKTGQTVLFQMVRMYFEGLGKGIIVADPDVAFTEGGKVRWIDTNEWTRSAKPSVIKREYLIRFAQAMQRVNSKGEVLTEFLKSWFNQLKNSKDFNEAEKIEFLNGFVDLLRRNLGDETLGLYLVRSGLILEKELKIMSLPQLFFKLYGQDLSQDKMAIRNHLPANHLSHTVQVVCGHCIGSSFLYFQLI